LAKGRIEDLERRIWRMEKLVWYVAGITSIKGVAELIPIVQALLS
jgi:hypothetical protein